MRDYVFRGKNESGEWVYGSLVHVGDFCCIMQKDDGTDYNYPYLDPILGCIDGYITPVDPDTVGQFTGLLDKNGKRIFEGDVIKHHWADWDVTGTVWTVIWKDHSCGFEPFSDSERNCHHCDGGRDPSECYIIGNRFDGCDI